VYTRHGARYRQMSAQRRLRALDTFVSGRRLSPTSALPGPAASSLQTRATAASAVELEPVLSADFCAGQWVAAHKDINYSGVERGHPRHKLDVYRPWHSSDGHEADPRVLHGPRAPTEQQMPVVFFIHGGGWGAGDKGMVTGSGFDYRIQGAAGSHGKPLFFTQHGCVFVSANYRLRPDATIDQMAQDLAKALAWVRNNIARYGGDPGQVIVMGHSAGAQLAALLCTDESYLKAEGVRFDDMLRGCIPVDSDTNDVVVEVTEHGKWSAGGNSFGDNPDVWRALSPCTHCKPGKHIPPFLILHIQDLNAPGGERGSGDGVLRTPRQAQLLAKSLRSANVRVEVRAGAGKTHVTLDSEIGRTGDQITAAVEVFMRSVLRA
jgi:arylformamidase